MKKNQKNNNGDPHGYWEDYWHNGKVWYKGNYINGVADGYWEIHSALGGHGNGCYKNGQRYGYWEWYTQSGELEEQIFYA